MKKLKDRIIINMWKKKKKKLGSEIEDYRAPMKFEIPKEAEEALKRLPFEIQDHDIDELLIKRYEKENPGKHAYWHGKMTKQFLKWKKDELSKMQRRDN